MVLEFKGSKGEWAVSTSGNPTFKECVVAEDGGSVAFITNWSEAEYNAKLIAAAPDLLEALQNLENDSNQIPENAWRMVKKAIEKALK